MSKLLLLILLLVVSSCKSKSDIYYISDNIIHANVNCEAIKNSSVIFKMYRELDTYYLSFCKSCMSEKDVLFLDRLFVAKDNAEIEMHYILIRILNHRGKTDYTAFENSLYNEVYNMSDQELYSLFYSISSLHEKYENERDFKFNVRRLFRVLEKE